MRQADSYRAARRNERRALGVAWPPTYGRYYPYVNRSKAYKPNGPRERARRARQAGDITGGVSE